MTRGKLIIFTDPASPEVEDEYNAWYDDIHIPEVVEHVPGIVSGSRFKAVPGQPSNFPGEPSYVAIYDIETDDITTTISGLTTAIQSGKLHLTAALNTTAPSLSMFVEELGG